MRLHAPGLAMVLAVAVAAGCGGTTTVTQTAAVRELAHIVEGTSPIELFEPLDTGVWIRVDVDTVRSIDQQYRP